VPVAQIYAFLTGKPDDTHGHRAGWHERALK
jgi:hypothetical protein